MCIEEHIYNTYNVDFETEKLSVVVLHVCERASGVFSHRSSCIYGSSMKSGVYITLKKFNKIYEFKWKIRFDVCATACLCVCVFVLVLTIPNNIYNFH